MAWCRLKMQNQNRLFPANTSTKGLLQAHTTCGKWLLFGMLWCLTFAVYLPAARAGFVTDFTGWLDQVRNHPFGEYINRTNFHIHSLYQFTQFNTYLFYKLFGINPWLWHLLFITLHTINAVLVYRFTYTLLADWEVKNSAEISLAGVILFCLSPYNSEVIVWEPSFHFLQGLLLIMLILLCVQQFVGTGKPLYVWLAAVLYLLSSFALELFYVTPWLVLALTLFYGSHPGYGKKTALKLLAYFFTPLIVMFFTRLILFRIAYGGWVSRIGTDAVTAVKLSDFAKPAKYLFHLLFLGRFYPDNVRQQVYSFCDSIMGIVAFYGLVAAISGYILLRFTKMTGKARIVSLFFVFTLVALALNIPLWFSDTMLVLFDRYTYLSAPFVYMLVALLLSFISQRSVRIAIIAAYALANLRFTILVSRYWGKSSRINNALLQNLPALGGKSLILILLNLPESMHGVPMIGSGKESEFKLMHNLLIPDKAITTEVYDVLSYNMLTPSDGAHVSVINDSTVRVTLNQWGTWWWFAGQGGNSYENKDYKLNLIDGGHFYELTLKHPSAGYLLLFEVGDQWKTVEMSKKGQEQW